MKSELQPALPEMCFEQNQIIAYPYYAYSANSFADVVIASGDCENQPSEQERAASCM